MKEHIKRLIPLFTDFIMLAMLIVIIVVDILFAAQPYVTIAITVSSVGILGTFIFIISDIKDLIDSVVFEIFTEYLDDNFIRKE